MAFAISREHRSRQPALVERNCGRVMTRIINPDSELASLLIRDLHESHNCAAASSLEYHLLRTGVYFKGAQKQIQLFAKNCHRCNLRKGKRNNTRDLMSQSLPGPTEELATLFSNVVPHSHVQIDYAGPLHIKGSGGGGWSKGGCWWGYRHCSAVLCCYQ